MWHHATISAVPGDYPDGPSVCDGMPPGSVNLHVWAPGGDNLVLPEHAGLLLPEGTSRLALEMHVLRTSEAPAQRGSVGVCLNHAPVDHLLGLMAVAAPVPAIRPHTTETSRLACEVASATHLWSVWPHMHQVGAAIESNLVRAGGERVQVNRVDPWDFHHQRTYPLDVDVAAGDTLEGQCWWTNPTSDYVLPGLLTRNEMCNQVFMGWPATTMRCQPAD